VSYHETYEFLAIDRCLTPAEMRALRAISTRATITPTRFYNYYEWGGLKADAGELLRRYFDLFVYREVHSGARWAMLRFPTDRIELRRWRPYVSVQRGAASSAPCASVAIRESVAILAIAPPDDERWDEEREDEWADDEALHSGDRDDESVDESSWLAPLALTRAELLAGDLRPLYLLWLGAVQCGDRRATTLEPPRPAGLEHMTGTLHALAEFLRLDADLLAAAVEERSAEPRPAGEILRAAGARSAARRRAAAAKAAAAKTRRLRALARRQDEEWLVIDRLVGEGKTNAYDDAVRRLVALRELSVDRGTDADFRERLVALLGRHRTKRAFGERVRDARLSSPSV
jgi:hypothetical protein